MDETSNRGLHYNRFRYYDPETAQYISPDPIGLAGGDRPYGYVHNPISWVDPLGLANYDNANPSGNTGNNQKNNVGIYRPERSLPRDKYGNPIPDVDAPHPQLGTKSGRHGYYTQAREWAYNTNGKLVPIRDIDFTDHGRPQNHPNPHQHDYIPNPTGGTPQRSKTAKPLEY